MTTPADLLAAARDLLKRTDPATAGLWPRAAALLARQALEMSLDNFWREKGVALAVCPTRPQLLCLPTYLDHQVAGCVHEAWGALSHACHHHPYEISPSSSELRALLDTVGEFHAAVAGPRG